MKRISLVLAFSLLAWCSAALTSRGEASKCGLDGVRLDTLELVSITPEGAAFPEGGEGTWPEQWPPEIVLQTSANADDIGVLRVDEGWLYFDYVESP
ncbi:MAG: hypothetical protein H6740_27190 [Alphaproteobacteria bacterium]|nr:hypothetical protein [Alphaproteobacteria bacterium]